MSINKFAVIGSSLIVIASVAAGLILSGAPGEQRLKRLDSTRVSDLREIVSVMDFYTRDHDELPATLGDLVDGRLLTRMPSDPVTGIPYYYEILSPTHYKLCALFDRSSNANLADDFWTHGVGEECYEFDVHNDE